MVKKFAACLAIALMTAAVSATAQQQPAKAAATAPAAAPKAAGEDRYIGYYYPKPTATETGESSMQTIAGAERAQRVQFVTVV